MGELWVLVVRSSWAMDTEVTCAKARARQCETRWGEAGRELCVLVALQRRNTKPSAQGAHNGPQSMGLLLQCKHF